jgi:hypothetical protein
VTPTEAADALPEAIADLAQARTNICTIEQTYIRRRAEMLEVAMAGEESIAAAERVVEVNVKDLAVDREAKRRDLKIAEDRRDMLSLLAAL